MAPLSPRAKKLTTVSPALRADRLVIMLLLREVVGMIRGSDYVTSFLMITVNNYHPLRCIER